MRIRLTLLALASLVAGACGHPAEGGAGGSTSTGLSGETHGTTGDSSEASSSSESSATGSGTGSEEEMSPEVHFFVDARPQDESDPALEADEARWGDPIRIVSDGLQPGATLRVAISTQAWGIFRADEDGTVDLGRDAPSDGTWSTADADGPFWSAPKGASPTIDVGVWVSDADSGAPIASGSVHRRSLDEGIETEAVNVGTRVGLLARPARREENAKLPAILTFGGSEGGVATGERQARYFAQLGYVTFGVGYFGAPGLPASLEEVPLEILEDDLGFLASLPDVDPDRIAVIGASRGGELALLLGATFPEAVRAVVGQMPSAYVWGAFEGPVSSWSYGGVGLPYVPGSGDVPEPFEEDGRTFLAYTPAFLGALDEASPGELEAARIPVEDVEGPILLLGGGDDQLWPSCHFMAAAWAQLGESGHRNAYGDELHCFPDAGHNISSIPGSSTLAADANYLPSYDLWLLQGGTHGGIARGIRGADTAMRGFLERELGR